MRKVLLQRVRPLIDRLASELVDLMVARIDAEIDRVNEACEVAVSAYADDCAGDILTAALGPELGAMLNAGPVTHAAPVDIAKARAANHAAMKKPFPPLKPAPIAQRDAKPAKSPRGRTDKTALQANGKQPPKCKKCGYVGGNSRGCGRSHPMRSAVAKTSASDDESEGAVAGVSQSTRPRRIEWDEQRDLIARVQQHGDQRALDMLVRSNIGLVHRLARKCPWHVMPYEDIVQEGTIGLIKGIQKFDLAKPFKLSTYASNWIWHHIARSHEDGAAIRLPARLGMVLVKVSRAQFKLEEQLGRPATAEEIAELARLPVRDVRRVLERGQITTSLDQVDAEGTSWMHDQIAADLPGPDAALAETADTAELMAVVNELPPRHAKIVAHRFVDGMTLDETAEAVAPLWKGRVLSRERVRQIELHSLQVLRSKLRDKAAA